LSAKNSASQPRQNANADSDKSAGNGWSRRRIWITAVVVALAVIGIAAFFPVALYTDQSKFCKTCHTMQPFYQAWQTGDHFDVQCIQCHVDPGYQARFLHKVVALQEGWIQLVSHPKFPNYNADVTNARCLKCHKDLPKSIGSTSKFSHADHIKRNVRCAICHPTVGHKVTYDALRNAGILNQSQVATNATYVGQQYPGVKGKHSVLPRHRVVPCSNCHDMANQKCSACHKTPANHYAAECTICHDPQLPFTGWIHPNTKAPHGVERLACKQCHPTNYTTYYCTCHKNGSVKDD
jgi:nitrate/TMAO reductase-like tetraheme cytochrome c subunit